MDRREFIENIFRIGGVTALALSGISLKEAFAIAPALLEQCSQSVSCTGDVVESATVEDSSASVRYDSSEQSIAQTFLTTSSHLCCSIIFKLLGVDGDALSGNIWAELWDTSSGSPNAKLNESVYIDVTTISQVAAEEIEFTFTSPTLLANATTYAAVLTGDWTIDSADFVYVRGDSNEGYANGTQYTYNGAAWGSQSYDLYFKVKK